MLNGLSNLPLGRKRQQDMAMIGHQQKEVGKPMALFMTEADRVKERLGSLWCRELACPSLRTGDCHKPYGRRWVNK